MRSLFSDCRRAVERWQSLLFGAIAEELGLVTREQIEQCIREQESSLDPVTIGELLVKKGFLDRSKVARVLEEQQKRIKGYSDIPLFGHLALEKGYLSASQLGECLREKIRLGRAGVRRNLGEIMLKKRYLSAQQFVEIIHSQSKELYKCINCNSYFAFPDGDWKLTCENCAGAMVKVYSAGDIRSDTQVLKRPSGPMATRLGKYEILQEIGRGGMAIVYKARDTSLGRMVALKILKEAGDNLALIKRLHNEAMIASKLSHPNIITIHEIAVIEGVHALCMDFIEGQDLTDHVMQQRVSLRERLELLVKVADAVNYAHSQGVIHRDLKPSNILIDRSGRPIITDFGLAKLIDSAFTQTREGSSIGTPYYMAPEQVLGAVDEVDHRTDVYSLGVILYELIANRVPFMGKNVMDVYQKILTEPPARLRTHVKDVDPDLEAVCLKAMEKEKALRYSSAQAFAQDLRSWLAGERVQASRTSTIRYAIRRLRRHRRTILTVAALVLASVALTLIAMGMIRRASFNAAVSEADRLYLDKKYREAREQYLKVLAMDDTHLHARSRVRECDSALAEEERQTKLRALKGRAAELMNEGRFEEAKLEYEQALRIDPNDLQAQEGKAECDRKAKAGKIRKMLEEADRLFGERRFDEARTAYERVLAEDGSVVAAITGKSECEKQLARARDDKMHAAQEAYNQAWKKYTEALKVFEEPGRAPQEILEAFQNVVDACGRVLRIDPDHADALLLRAKALVLAGMSEEAFRDLNRAIQLRPSSSEAYYQRGKLSLQELLTNSLEGVESLHHPALLDLHLLHQLIFTERNLRLLRACQEDFDNAVMHSRNDETRVLYAAYHRAVSGETIDAIHLFGRLTMILPREVDGYMGRAITFLMRGELPQAIEELDEASALWPGFAFIPMIKACCYSRLGKFDLAIAEFQRVQRQLGGSRALNNIGWMYVLKGDTAQALDVFQQCLRRSPGDSFIIANLALTRLLRADYEEAIKAADECIRLNNADIAGHLIAGSAYAAVKDYPNAERAYERILHIIDTVLRDQPQWVVPLLLRASLAIKLNRPEEAEEALRQVMEASPRDPVGLLIRGQLHQARGKKEPARADFELAKKLAPMLTVIANAMIKRLEQEAEY